MRPLSPYALVVTAKRSPRGRPPASSAAATRKRIVDVARRCFAESGYDGTTNRMIADGADITTGAIYHYFDSKQAIFLAVLGEVETQVYEKYVSAEASASSLHGKIVAMREACHELNRQDSSLAQFVGSARRDLRRHPELFAETNDGLDGDWYYLRLIEQGVERGEIDRSDGEALRHFLRAISVGLTDGVSHDQSEHRLALDGLRFVLAGGMSSSTDSQSA